MCKMTFASNRFNISLQPHLKALAPRVRAARLGWAEAGAEKERQEVAQWI